MQFVVDPEKTRFDVYFAADLADALNEAQRQAQRLKQDTPAVEVVLTWLALHFHLDVRNG